MKIIYNCTSLEYWDGRKGQDSGIQRVMRELGTALCGLSNNVLPAVFDTDGRCFRLPLSRKAPRGGEIGVERGDLIFSAGHDWDCLAQFEAAVRYADAGVYFGTLFHDTMPVNLPFTYRDEFVARFKRWLEMAVEVTDLCFANSDCTRRDVQAYAAMRKLNCKPIELIRLGDNIPSSSAGASPDIAEKIARPYILAVGTREFRKNHGTLLNAYRMLLGEMQFDPPVLYIVGAQGLLDGGIHEQAAGDPQLGGKVEVLSGVSDASLRALYENAMFTVYPSVCEGWGLPVAESLCYGKQCITSRCSSMLEIAPELTRFAHPLCPDQWALQIRELCSDAALLAAESRQVRECYKPVTWLTSARKLMAVLGQTLPILRENAA